MIKSYKEKLKNVDERYYYTDIQGVAIIHKKDLALVLGVTVRSIENYEKQGLKKYENSPPRTPMYNLIDSIKWYLVNIQGVGAEPTADNNSDAYEQFLANLDPTQKAIFERSNLDPIDKLSRLKDIERKEIRNNREVGEWYSRDDVDKRLTSLAVLLMSSLKEYEQVASEELANKPSDQIEGLIRKAHDTVALNLSEVISNHFSVDGSLCEVINTVQSLLLGGCEPMAIIKKIEELK